MAFKLAFIIQLQDYKTGLLLQAAGGKALICVAGDTVKQGIYDLDGEPIDNPVSLVNGRLSFQTDSDAPAVDIYLLAPTGHFIVSRGHTPGQPEIFLDTGARESQFVFPFAAANYAAGVEQDSGFDFPVGALLYPTPALQVVTVEAAKTVNVGLLSSQSGGDADGFLVAASLATAGVVKGTLAGTDTLGALLKADTNASTVLVPEPAVISAATRLTFTLSAATASAKGIFVIPYSLGKVV